MLVQWCRKVGGDTEGEFGVQGYSMQGHWSRGRPDFSCRPGSGRRTRLQEESPDDTFKIRGPEERPVTDGTLSGALRYCFVDCQGSVRVLGLN